MTIDYTIVQILTSLPGEIHNEILQYLSFRERLQMAQVCKAWRNLVLSWQPQWKCLPVVDDRCSFVPDMLPYAPFIESRTVKQIKVHYYLDHDHLSTIMEFIQKQQFHAISKVDLAVQEFTKDQFKILIDTCGNVLKDIKVKGLGKHKSNIRPDALLKHCPSLVKLEFNGCVFMDEYWGEDQQAKGHWDPVDLMNLKHKSLLFLSLRFHNLGEFRNFNPSPFLKAVPRLRYLSMNIAHLQVVADSLAKIIRKYCPELVALVLYENVRRGETIPKKKFQTLLNYKGEEKIQTRPEEGLRHLIIHEHNYAQTARRICTSLIDQFHNSFFSLDFRGAGTINNGVLYHISTLPFPSLKHLKLEHNDYLAPDLHPPTLLSIFQQWDIMGLNNNNLTHLALSNLNINVNDDLLTMISVSCTHLEDLTLDNCHGVFGNGMINFLERQNQRHQLSTAKNDNSRYLQSITLSNARRAMDSDVMFFMAKEMGYLKQVVVEGARFDYDGYDHMNSFVSVRADLLMQQQQQINNIHASTTVDEKIQLLEYLEISFYVDDSEYDSSNTDIDESSEHKFQSSMNSIAKTWAYIIKTRDEDGEIPSAVITKRKVTNTKFK
ncbi:hypothetical protein BDC45DRAFT_12213 [Circinella umbellata]|nr:hypothetical protein BDC45DRAFT_12213 [Circinella umbellata]